MKPEKFRKSKERLEKRLKRQITDEEFEKILKKQKKIDRIVNWICLPFGLSIAFEWPGRWLEPFVKYSSYLGWAIVVLIIWGFLEKK